MSPFEATILNTLTSPYPGSQTTVPCADRSVSRSRAEVFGRVDRHGGFVSKRRGATRAGNLGREALIVIPEPSTLARLPIAKD